MIRVAIADDSPFTCKLLASYLQEGGDCEIVGIAHDARSTLDLVQATSPDVLTLDLQMPGVNGLELLRQVAEGPPVAVVVISGVTRLAAATTLNALELGAVDFILKFTPGAPVSRASLKREILTKVKSAAAAQPIARRMKVAPPPVAAPPPVDASRIAQRWAARAAASATTATAPTSVLIIGASTGGPRAICELLDQLPAEFGVPCVIVQHLPASFTAPFAAQLGRRARSAVKEAESGDKLAPGRALVAPGAFHLVLRPGGAIELQQTSDDDLYKPSIDRTMVSAAECYGSSAMGVVLSGMGHDGAEGLTRIREAGGVTYAQDIASCVMPAMPARAIERGAAAHVARPDRIGQMLADRGRP